MKKHSISKNKYASNRFLNLYKEEANIRCKCYYFTDEKTEKQ